MGTIQRYLIYALAIALVVVGGLYLWQRITVVKQQGQINQLTVETTDLKGQVADAKANVAAAKKAQKAQQKIANDAAVLLAKVGNINPTKCLEAKDEKTISDITYFFNSRGLLTADGDTKANGQVLPAASKTDIVRPGWTTKDLIGNYLIVIDYTLKLEKTVNCYETVSP